MNNQKTVICVFCKGSGSNPHFKGTCPVCKGRGKNEVVGKYMTCSSCRGFGQKGGTTLTCYDCGGLGLVPDTRETFRKAREEIGEAQEEIVREREEFRERPPIKERPMIKMTKKAKKHNVLKREDEEDEKPHHFCQCCADEVAESVTVKICFECFNKVKELRGYKEL